MSSQNTWSATRLATVRRCFRLAHYRYVLDLGEPTADVAAFGSVGHAHLERDLLAGMGITGLMNEPAPLADRFEAARLDCLLVGYRVRWESTRWEVLGVEVPFEYELGGHVITGRMDGIVRDLSDGRIYVLEHKFTSADVSPGSVYWERLTLDVQVSIYIDAAAILGHDVAGVVYDVIAKPAHKPKLATPEGDRLYTKGKGCRYCGGSAGGKGGVQRGRGSVAVDGVEIDCLSCGGDETKPGNGWRDGTELPRLHADQRADDEPVEAFAARVMASIVADPDDYYRRVVIVRTEDELPKMRTDILDTIKLARAAELFEVAPRNPDACLKYGSRCFFWDACTGAADINDRIRFPRRARTEPTAPSPA